MDDSSAELRKCKVCGQEKALTGNFHLTGSPSSGKKRHYEWRCLTCWAEIRRNTRRVDLAKSRAGYAAYYGANREAVNAAKRSWVIKNKEKVLSTQRQKRFENRERDRPYFRERQRVWRENNRQQSRLNAKEQRAKRRRVKVERITKKQIDDLREKQGARCAICRKKLVKEHIDHIHPIAKGGAHEIRNLQLLCPPCNMSKHDAHPIDFMQKLGFLL